MQMKKTPLLFFHTTKSFFKFYFRADICYYDVSEKTESPIKKQKQKKLTNFVSHTQTLKAKEKNSKQIAKNGK